MPRALIIGAGPGGLATALALKQIGLDVAVFERAPELKEIGAGLTLWPNAVKILDRLGVGPQLRAQGHHATNGALQRWDGQLLLPMRSQDFEHHFGAPSIPIHRAALQSLLADAVGRHLITLNAPATAFTQTATTVTAHFTNHPDEHADLLVAADGIRSTLRAQLVPDAPPAPRYAGYFAWRGVADFDPARVTPGETWGQGPRFGAIPIAPTRVYWFATQNSPPDTTATPKENKSQLLSLFAHWHPPIPDLIRATPDHAILRNDLYDLPPLNTWTTGRAALLGDAAHATTPNLGQGACMAIEDAAVLAKCIQQLGPTPTALQRYQQLRLPRTTRVITESRKLGQLAQWTHPLACFARNTLVKLSPPSSQIHRMQWLLAYEPPTDVTASSS